MTGKLWMPLAMTEKLWMPLAMTGKPSIHSYGGVSRKTSGVFVIERTPEADEAI